nr:CST complex subunit CTC1 isoform X6 [Pelodiscus sinensis]|eukprot:XP_014433962.1 CST complex subunit CTC1 isoform X6 [Pelodiscus sinensis]
METAGAALGMAGPGGGAEPRWLQAARAFVCETLCPAGPGGGGPEQLADSVRRCLRSTWGGRSGEFPLGYSFISISDLQCQQHTPCCSHMTWSTREFKEWAHQDEVIVPKQSVLPRAHLILIGYLTDGRKQEGKAKLMDGNLYVQDNTGSMPCELLHFDFEWLELLFLFPSWAYIPHTSQSSAGYVEILADPVPVDIRPERVVNTIPVFYPATAAQLLSTRFCCFFGRRRLFICSGPQRPGIAEKFLVPILKAVVPCKERVRDVHREILADMHHCPLQQYQPLEPPCQAPPLSLLCSVAEQRSWEAFNPSQLLSHLDAQHMGTQELNRRLAWSYNAFSAESFQPRMVLLGVLRASSSSGSLQLRDKSDLLPCVISHRDGSPFSDTALIGSLLQVEAYQLVVERFLQSDFPSWEQLLTPEHVRGKETRLYVQFCFEDVQILHMPERHVQEGPTSSDSPLLGKKDGQCSEVELRSPEAKVPKLERTSPGAGTAECCDRGQSSARGTSCMSRLFLVTQKEGLMSRNYLPAAGGDGKGQDLQLSFQVTVLWMSKPQLWRHPREIGNLPELEQTNKDSKAQQRALLFFMGRSLRWFPFLHPDGLYRLIVPQCLDFGVFEQTGLSPLEGRLLNQSGCPSYLLVSDTWHLQHETWLTCLAQPQAMPESVCPIPASTVFSIPELLSNSFTGSLVSFSGVIVERTLCAEKFSTPCDMRRQKGTLLCWDHSVKLSVSAAPGSSAVLDVYIASAFLQHLWGLLPGAKILFQNLQRKISRFHNVYCTYIASSCISILALPPSCLLLSSNPAGTAFKSPADTSPTLVVLSELLLQPHSLSQGQILCHLSCVLDLSVQWICSDCSSIFREGRCSRQSPPCPSHTGVSKAFARILVEDGTGEVLVLCRNQQVAALLGLSPAEWNVVQSSVQSRGSILIQHGGAGARPWCVEEPEDPVTCYLRNLCRSRAISRPMLLDFSLDRKPSKIPQPDSSQPRRFLTGEVEYISRVGARLSLMCLNIQEADPKVLCGLTSKRIKTWISHSA